jgi:nicotinamide riboside transporter PnuC
MSLETTTDKIDGILWAVVLIVSGVLWAVAGFPYLTEVVIFVGLVITGLFILWLTDRPQRKNDYH